MEPAVAEDQPLLRRRIAAPAILLSLAIVVVAERDLAARPAREIRGSKLVWRIGCTNALGAAAYLRWGRLQPG